MGGMMQKLVLSWSWECKMFTTGQHLWRERGRIEQGKSQTSWLAAQYSLIKPLANLSQLLGTEHWPKQSSPNKVTWSGFVTFTLAVTDLENGLPWMRCLLEVGLQTADPTPHSYAANHALKKGIAGHFCAYQKLHFFETLFPCIFRKQLLQDSGWPLFLSRWLEGGG